MKRREKRNVVGAVVAGCALAVSSAAWATTAETPDPAAAVSYRAFNGDQVHVFTNSGAFTVTSPGLVRLLVVGGGGGGGTGGGGGGGGGQVVEQTLELAAGEYAVTVGAGGAIAQPGGDSFFGNLVTALGGGKGGGVNSGGGKGANGGGGGFSWSGTSGGTATAGFAGGSGASKGGGGGGGAGAVGFDSQTTNTVFNRNIGTGGIGVCSDITGAPVWYAGGGGGGGYSGYGGYGGKGGGGDGGKSSSVDNVDTRGHAGRPNTGGGGGGGGMYGNTQYDGAAGGSGVVVVRYSDGTTPPVAETDKPLAAVEGAVSTRVAPDGSIVHIFSGDGTFTVEQGGAIELLVVGGGGGGSVQNSYGAGGGAGGLVLTNLTVAPGTYGIRVGAGGIGGFPGNGTCGEPSCFGGDAATARFGIVALGGGGAREFNQPGITGGSGGGGGRRNGGAVSEAGAGVEGQGHAGGLGCYKGGVYGDITCPRSCGGGGGGAGEPGHDGFAETDYGAGGDGRLIDITGEPVWYAGGGGAGNQDAVGSCAGGQGGGAGGSYWTAGANGVDGTGGGGGGGGGTGNDDSTTTRSTPAGNGGSGVVIVRYRADWKLYGEATGGAVKRVKGKTVHTFTASGTFTVTRPGHYEFFLVGGGGGGGHFGGGGGGAGGVVLTNGYLLAGEYAVTVGAGGKCGFDGADSSVATFVAVGGGGGGDYPSTGHGGPHQGNGGDGGSGGGGSRLYGTTQLACHTGGKGTAGQGFDGGFGRRCVNADGKFENDAGGGGGGAGGPGHDGYLPDAENGGFIDANDCVSTAYICDARGGDGVMCDFDGVEKWYAGGGGGSLYNTYVTAATAEGSGGLGGGGHGSGSYGAEPENLLKGQDGEPNTGGGGGGGGAQGNTQFCGGTGGSGIVMIRYIAPPKGALIIVR